MIAPPGGWIRRPSGHDLLFFPADGGPERTILRYRERSFPTRPIRALVDDAVARTAPAFAVTGVGAVERLTTVEGEHAAAVTVAGAVAGRPVQRDLGFVLLDDVHARLDALTAWPRDFAAVAGLVRELVRGDVQLAGERRRWFEYDPPAGWQARARGLQAEWYPLDFPRAFGLIGVWPALPAARVGADFVAVLRERDALDGWEALAADAPEAFTTAHGLSGTIWRTAGHVAGRSSVRVVALAADERYVYPLRLETTVAAHEEAFRALVRSARPVPRPVAADARGREAHLAQWAE